MTVFFNPTHISIAAGRCLCLHLFLSSFKSLKKNTGDKLFYKRIIKIFLFFRHALSTVILLIISNLIPMPVYFTFEFILRLKNSKLYFWNAGIQDIGTKTSCYLYGNLDVSCRPWLDTWTRKHILLSISNSSRRRWLFVRSPIPQCCT